MIFDEFRFETAQKHSGILNRFHRNDSLLKKKLYNYLPFLVLTNLSSLLLVSVDGLVVGNLVGSSALSSVNMFYPIITMIGVFSVLIATGSATVISTTMGNNDVEELSYQKKAAKVMMILSALIVAVIQIPIVSGLIFAYHLPGDLNRMVWQYGVGVMISMPFGLISTVGVYELQILGKTKMLAVLAAVEGIANLLLDLLFVGALHMGVAGAGYGTAGANLIRCSLTVIYLATQTDIYKSGRATFRLQDVKRILSGGLSETAYSVMLALQNYVMIKILFLVFGESGGVINEVCTFCLSIANVIVMSIQGSARPLAGMFIGAKDTMGVRMLIRRSALLMAVLVGLTSIGVVLMPELFYKIHGVSRIPEGGILSLRLFALCFVLRGINAIFRLYFANRGDNVYSAVITVVGYAILPLFAYVFQFILPTRYDPYLWGAFFLTELIIVISNLRRYFRCVKSDMRAEDAKESVLYLTIAPDEAIDASRELRGYAKANGYPERIAYRAGLCMEEMVAYAHAANGDDGVNTQIMVRFLTDTCVFMIIDDGECIMLNEDHESKDLISNYALIKKIAKEINYQYVLNLNYSVFTFQ